MEEKDSLSGTVYYDNRYIKKFTVKASEPLPSPELLNNLTAVQFNYTDDSDFESKAECAMKKHIFDHRPPSLETPMQPPVLPEVVSPAKPGVSGNATPAAPDNTYYTKLDEKCDEINALFKATELTKDYTLAKEGDVYHIKNAATNSDIVVNRDSSMKGVSHSLTNMDDKKTKAMVAQITADMVAMVKMHKASGSTEPLHLEIKLNEPVSDEQRIYAKQVERLVQHNLEKEFDNKDDKENVTFAGKPIPPYAPPAPPVQKPADSLSITPKGSTGPGTTPPAMAH